MLFRSVRDPDGHRLELYTSDYFTMDHDHEPLRWSLKDPRRQTLWGAPAPRSWFEEGTPFTGQAVREPSFVAAALVVKHTDVVATLPGHIGHMLARELNLRIIRPPLVLPRVPIGLYWHERAHRDEANRWLRSIFIRLFTGDPWAEVR